MRKSKAFFACLTLIVSLPSFSSEITDASGSCNTDHGETTPSDKFSSVQEGTIIHDNTTGLDWMRCPVGMEWDGDMCQGSASRYSLRKFEQLAVLTGDDWRLPTIEELNSIVEKCRKKPAINLNIFPNTPEGFFWSSSQPASMFDDDLPSKQQGVLFLYGSEGKKVVHEQHYARFVRSQEW